MHATDNREREREQIKEEYSRKSHSLRVLAAAGANGKAKACLDVGFDRATLPQHWHTVAPSIPD